MNYFNVDRQFKAIEKNFNKDFKQLSRKCDFILGEHVAELELELEKYTNSRCVTVGNGTDALYVSLLSLGLSSSDEIIVPSFTWVSTAEVVLQAGCKLVLCDIDKDNFNLDLEDLKNKITDKTKAIIPVSLFGQISNLKEIMTLAKSKGITVIEDAAQSFGATHYGELSCSIADISTTSFFPTKPLSCWGDGGAIFTKSEELYDELRVIPRHGQKDRKYNFTRWGINSRLDSLQALVLLNKFKIFPSELSLRQKKAIFYFELFSEIKDVTPPVIEDFNKSVFGIFTLKINDYSRRDDLKDFLKMKGIPTTIYYPPLHHSSIYSVDYELPNTDSVFKSVLSIPFDAYIYESEQRAICSSIKEFFMN